MIFDKIENLGCYRGLTPNVDRFIEYALEHDLSALAPGRYTVCDGVFFDIKCYEPRTPEIAKCETHQEYIDLQYLIEGCERMDVSSPVQLQVREVYDPKTDKQLYVPSPEMSTLHMKAGDFALLFPQDAHHPSIIDGKLTHNKKAVVKIHV